ncbi:unnamed protein product (macronuclear) [Paramecium tetraurelia]|uniref:H-type lectin domain-containing protein n=1 Tax=Paramecium tetraurelia TaxID=5888 RepID=A0BGK7_PARTE|nr:uncharacterized protein GSPATT00028709001 [Paramecium tetraurelia]CAK57674.1 unnamed protein product [Paramecium tetraurelia]|eukprot:XP_001425072.1 hypothetical protein (macronuclear) [Paramecium tetraurelia strain d4-2]
MKIRIILHIVLSIFIIVQMIRHSQTTQTEPGITPELFQNSSVIENNNTNCKKMIKFYDKQLMIQKLSYPENVSVEIHQSLSFHINPKILIDEAQFSITMNGDFYQLHQTESLKIKFIQPQIINLFLIHIKVSQFDYQNFYNSEIDELQVRRIKIFGIYKNQEFLLLNKQIFKRNDRDIYFKSSNSRKYLKVYVVCKMALCENAYRSFRMQFISQTQQTHIYPVTLYQINDIELLQFGSVII